ncbi:hypothetical protein PHYSODRAFT_325033 [Phytophthora sojae]|uniref:Uncharacterized protein n=1 Tax=Phytophthora sojae (strain P6497) TaxID=1094619 RepID=G4YXJ6_PHYSP|nr:hypothetical protein PHYSODRAFT_325033 [Phytophthora sojae]EGZ23857.1 hypothetical protein PHYSODRAFT_325033 [Phytophthora sojae]|eukprot:XP_009519145.1 hypothetical protein PHYSODRAFT_325033 [Phytophthora sojae]
MHVVGAGVRHAWRLHPSCWTLYSTSVLLDIVFGLDTELGVIRGDIPKFMPPCRAWCTCASEILPTTHATEVSPAATPLSSRALYCVSFANDLGIRSAFDLRSICPSTLPKVIILGSVHTAIMVGEAATLKTMTVVQVVLQQAADDYGERVNTETTFG